MWANADDQGRLPGEPEEVKYVCCPNIDHIAKTDIVELLKELDDNELIKVYNTSKTQAIQMLDWWDVQRLQWAYPSDYPPPEGWIDHLRYHPTPKEIITENWPPPVLGNLLPSKPPNVLPSNHPSSPLTTPSEKEEEKGRGRGRVPSALGSTPSPSPVGLALLENFPKGFGRKPRSRELAYLRDIEKEISAAGATHEQVYDAYKEAANQNKLHLSYVRAILLDWLGIGRGRGPP
jgi:hypothetical protein